MEKKDSLTQNNPNRVSIIPYATLFFMIRLKKKLVEQLIFTSSHINQN